jgi:hypothetical protein
MLFVLATLLAFLFFIFSQNKNQSAKLALQASFKRAEKDYKKRHFKKSLHNYSVYIKFAEQQSHSDKNVLLAIQRIGRIYLSIEHRPQLALNLLERFAGDPRLNDAENAEIHEWMEIAQQMLNAPPPSNLKNDNELFSKLFAISESYLIPFVAKFEKSPKSAEAMYMLAIIDQNIHTQKHAAQHFYLKETIRRAPHSDLAKRAYETLYGQINKEYQEQGLDEPPDSIKAALERFRDLSNLHD